jgi:uncharacterized protein (TIGR02722 family)
MKKKLYQALLATTITTTLFLSGCSGTTIQYTDPDAVDTTSLNFSSTDLQTTAKKMVDSLLTSPRIMKITQKSTPIIWVQTVENNTNEHIDTQAITNIISTELLNSGKFNFVDMSKVTAVKDQMQYQHYSGMVAQDKAVKIGQQVGAEYMLYGDISSISARNNYQQSQYFQITLKLMDLKSGLMVWQGQKQIRKISEKSYFGW